MPKRLEDVKKRLLEDARSIILMDGMEKLTLRRIANDCGIAVGTIYNYFQSREMMIAEVLLGDWLQSLSGMTRGISEAENVMGGLEAIFAELSRFVATYSPFWSNYPLDSEAVASYSKRHRMLIEQLESMVVSLFDRFKVEYDVHTPHYIGIVLLSTAVSLHPFSELAPFLSKLC